VPEVRGMHLDASTGRGFIGGLGHVLVVMRWRAKGPYLSAPQELTVKITARPASAARR
jgi:hypothetical protein